MPINSFENYPMSWKPLRDELPPGPVYLALAAKLEADIASGVLAVGTRLPPQRELADFLDLNFTTVTRAYDLCREKGLLRGVVGRGTFVADSCFDYSVVRAFPDIGEEYLTAAARRVVMRESSSKFFTYGSRDGAPDDREAGRLWLKRCGVDVSASDVTVFPGVQSALSVTLLTLLHAGDALAVDAFTYSNLIHLARMAHIRLIAVEGDEGGMLPDALERLVSDTSRVKGVFLMPNCANPTTITLSEARKDALMRVAARHDLLVLEDDASLEKPKSSVRTLFSRHPARTVYFAGTTRLLAPGLRVTFVATPSALTPSLRSGLHHLAIKASALESAILCELIRSGDAERILREKASAARAANAAFDRVFGGDDGLPTRLFRTLELAPSEKSGERIEAELSSSGFRVCHSYRFSVRAGETRSFLRVSVSS